MAHKGEAKPEEIALYLKEETALTIPAAYNSGNRIYALAKADNQFIFDTLNGLLKATCLSLNVSKSLNNFQAMEIIYMIMEKYKHLTVDSVVLAFRNGKMGKYGPTYNRVDIEIVTGWLDNFCASDEYIDAIEKANRKHEVESSPATLSDGAKDWLQKIKKTALDGGKERQDTKELAIRSEIRKQKLIHSLYTKSDAEIKQLKKEFEKEDYKVGIDILNKEISKRKNKSK